MVNIFKLLHHQGSEVCSSTYTICHLTPSIINSCSAAESTLHVDVCCWDISKLNSTDDRWWSTMTGQPAAMLYGGLDPKTDKQLPKHAFLLDLQWEQDLEQWSPLTLSAGRVSANEKLPALELWGNSSAWCQPSGLEGSVGVLLLTAAGCGLLTFFLVWVFYVAASGWVDRNTPTTRPQINRPWFTLAIEKGHQCWGQRFRLCYKKLFCSFFLLL